MPSNVRQLLENGTPIYPITERSLVIGLQDAPFEYYVLAWDGASTPVVSKIPAGVVVTYNNTNYTGILAASATTAPYLYLVASTTQAGEYDRYIVTNNGNNTFSWTPVGSTAPVTPVIVDNLTTNDATKALSAKQGKVLKDELSQFEAKVDNYYSGAYLDNTGAQITANGWGISDFVPYNGGGINYKWNDTYEDAPNGACIIFYNSSKAVIDYYSCAHATAESDGRTIGSVASGTAFVRLSFQLNTDSHIKTGGAIAWEPKTIKVRVEALENHTEEVEDEISFNAGIIRDKSYSADSVIFTKDQVPAGNTISVKLTFVTTSGAIRVFDSNGNTLKTFAATGQTVGSSKTFDDYKLPVEYAYCAQLSGYSAAVRAEITIKNRLISEVPSVIHNDVFFHVGYDVNNSGELSPVSYLTSTIFFAGKKDDVLNTSMPMYRVYVYDGNKSLIEQVASVQGQKTFTFTNASGKYFRIVFKNSELEYVPTISINGASLISSDIVETIQVSQGEANAVNGVRLGDEDIVVNKIATIPAATPTQNGYMSSEDKDKLDNISSEVPVNGVRLGSEDIVQNKVAIIPAASNSSNGYMSREDKIKLDSISSQSTITIEGSGITKNASAYGFLPTNTAPQNSVALQNCLDGGGLIVIDFPGIYEVDATHFIDSNTHIIFGENVYLKRVLSASNKCPRHVFVNRGAYNYTENSNIIIENLKILPNGYLEYDHNLDSSGVYGLRGLVAFFHVKNLLLDGVEVIDHTFGQYSIHVCTFENAIFNRIHVETLKDGIHLGNGRGFVIRNCQFLTNDDAIAINAADYPGSNAETGWLEDGIIENITFLKAPADSAYNTIRGVLMLSGAWKEWESGMSFRRNGDYVTSDGKIYQTDGPKTIEYITSTVQPVHTRGSVTGADGLTWVYKGEAKANNAGFRRIHFRNLYYYRKSTYLFLASVEDDAFMRAIYPGSASFKNENITFEAVYNLNDSDVFLNANAPIDNVRFLNNELRDFGASVIYLTKGEDTDVNVRMTFVGNTFGNDTRMIWKASETDWSATINLVGSLKDSGFTPVYSGITPTFINNDLT